MDTTNVMRDYTKVMSTLPNDPRTTRRDMILQELRRADLSQTTWKELTAELAEIEASLSKNPAEEGADDE